MNLISNKIDIDLAKQFNTNKFWGDLDSDAVLSFIDRKIRNKNKSMFVLKLDEINNFDMTFCEKVFVKIIKESRNTHDNFYVFDTSKEDMYLKIDNAFKNSKSTVVIRKGNNLSMVGDTSYPIKVIFKKLTKFSPVSSNVISNEIGINKEICDNYFQQVVDMGLAKKVSDELYTTYLSRMDLFSKIRYLLKSFKMKIFIKPFYTIHFYK